MQIIYVFATITFLVAVGYWGLTYYKRKKLSFLLEESRKEPSSTTSLVYTKEIADRLQENFFLEYLHEFFVLHQLILTTFFSLIFWFLLLYLNEFVGFASLTMSSVVELMLLSILSMGILSFVSLTPFIIYKFKESNMTSKFSILFRYTWDLTRGVWNVQLYSIFVIVGVILFFKRDTPHFISFLNDTTYSPFGFFEVSLSLAVGFMIIITLGEYIKTNSKEYTEKVTSQKNDILEFAKEGYFKSEAKFKGEYESFSNRFKTSSKEIAGLSYKRQELRGLSNAPLIFSLFAYFFMIFLLFGQPKEVSGVLINLRLSYFIAPLGVYILITFASFTLVTKNFFAYKT